MDTQYRLPLMCIGTEDAPRRKMEQIVNERKHTPKCRGCERLAKVVKENDHGNIR